MLRKINKYLNINTFTIIFLICVVTFFIYFIASTSDFFNLKCVISTVDGNKYCVRERKRINEAADLLATVANKCEIFVNDMLKKYPNDERIIRLHKNFDKKRCVETLPTSELKAYSENKGAKIAFCLNKNKVGTQLIDINTLTFVALHELSHVMSLSIGHDDEFWENFKFLLDNAVEMNIYKPIDYKSQPQDYCGLTITDNPYYDL